jgi:hypothetical protein
LARNCAGTFPPQRSAAEESIIGTSIAIASRDVSLAGSRSTTIYHFPARPSVRTSRIDPLTSFPLPGSTRRPCPTYRVDAPKS